MGSSLEQREGLTCLHCGKPDLTSTNTDDGGYETVSGCCKACGYEYVGDADCGPWSEATWTTNRRTGVIVWALLDEGATQLRGIFRPGCLDGAIAARDHAAKNPSFQWGVFIDGDEVHPLSGAPDLSRGTCAVLLQAWEFLDKVIYARNPHKIPA
jgi:hypothetical protein